MTNPNTNWHVIICSIVVLLITSALLFYKIPFETVGIIDGLLVGVFAQMGILQSADAQTVKDLTLTLAPQVQQLVAATTALAQKHEANAANVAQLHTAISVVAATTNAQPPEPLHVPAAVITTLPILAGAVSSTNEAHTTTNETHTVS